MLTGINGHHESFTYLKFFLINHYCLTFDRPGLRIDQFGFPFWDYAT